MRMLIGVFCAGAGHFSVFAVFLRICGIYWAGERFCGIIVVDDG